MKLAIKCLVYIAMMYGTYSQAQPTLSQVGTTNTSNSEIVPLLCFSNGTSKTIITYGMTTHKVPVGAYLVHVNGIWIHQYSLLCACAVGCDSIVLKPQEFTTFMILAPNGYTTNEFRYGFEYSNYEATNVIWSDIIRLK
jgi:hypothetical protein